MADVVIRAEGVGKQYRIGGKQVGYKTFREALTGTLRAPLQRLTQRANPDNTFWALKDVSFEVRRGEVLGVIGRNGAGKSTLLKILSRITEPTLGAVYVKGRVGALLEVGTGFHSELTGRENIYLSGAILGMKRAEISRKFDEIVAFADVEQFIDTPVKRYSSGMGLRLGFAVAAHLEPEILVVDEVLAVGDAEFQKKCLGKMGEVAGGGRTVLFVSHNMAAVESLCTNLLWIEKGSTKELGAPTEVIRSYLRASSTNNGYIDLQQALGHGQRSQPLMTGMRLKNAQGEISNQIQIGDSLTIEVDIKSAHPLTQVSLGIGINGSLGNRIATVLSRTQDTVFDVDSTSCIRCVLPSVPLMPGIYSIKLALAVSGTDVDIIESAAEFEVIPSDVLKSGKLPPSGIMVLVPQWESETTILAGGV